MRIKSALVVLTVFVNISLIYSQHDSINKSKIDFVIKSDVIYPVAALFEGGNVFSMTLETFFNKRYSIQITGYWAGFSETFDPGINSYSYGSSISNSILIVSDYKIFLNKKRNYSGLYSGLSLLFLQYYWKDELYYTVPPYLTIQDDEYKEFRIGLGPVFGYQNYIKKHFVVDLFVCPGISEFIKRDIISQGYPGSDDITDIEFIIRLGLNLGYKF